jgi:hypothetical protein
MTPFQKGRPDYFSLHSYQDSLNPNGTRLAAVWSCIFSELFCFYPFEETKIDENKRGFE